MAKKKKPAVNPARGFATTSTPSKVKPPTTLEVVAPSKLEGEAPTASEPVKASGEKIENEYAIPTEEEQEDFELQLLVEKQGPKVRKETQKIVNKAIAEKRTIRNICSPLKLERIFKFNLARYASRQRSSEVVEQEVGLGDRILELARAESIQSSQGTSKVWKGEAVLINGWILQRALLAMGFPPKRVEEGLQVLAGTSGDPLSKEKGLELAMEEIIEWLALNCDEDELPVFAEDPGAGNGPRKGDYGLSGRTPMLFHFPNG